MFKNKFVTLLFLLSVGIYASTASADQCLSETSSDAAFTMPKIEYSLLKPDEIKAELESWIVQTKATHPKFDMAIDYDQLIEIKDEIDSKIDRPMSQLEVFRVFSLMNPVFNDGHQGIALTGRTKKITEAIALGDRLFPFEVHIDDDYRLFVKKTHMGLDAGTEIFAVNGIKATKITRHLEQRSHGDSPRFRRQLVSDRFPELLWQHFGSAATFELTLNDKKDCKKTSYEGKKENSAHRMGIASFDHYFDLKFMENDSIAYLKLGTFSLPQGMEDQWKLFSERSFKEIKQANSKHLIIDIRENGGGDDDMWIEGVMPYIANKEWQRMANFLGRVRETDDAFPGRIGEVAVFDFQGKYPVSEQHFFDGKVYVITGHLSYSSAIMLASVIQDNKLGQIVGKETDVRGCSTGMYIFHDMPITGLLAFTPQHWYQRNDGMQSCMSGIKADIVLTDDPFNSNHLIQSLVEKIMVEWGRVAETELMPRSVDVRIPL